MTPRGEPKHVWTCKLKYNIDGHLFLAVIIALIMSVVPFIWLIYHLASFWHKSYGTTGWSSLTKYLVTPLQCTRSVSSKRLGRVNKVKMPYTWTRILITGLCLLMIAITVLPPMCCPLTCAGAAVLAPGTWHTAVFPVSPHAPCAVHCKVGVSRCKWRNIILVFGWGSILELQ